MRQAKAKSDLEGSAKPLLHLFDRSQPIDPQRSRTMSRIRGKDTKPEMILRRALWAEGLRFRVHDRSLPGTPDISNKSRRVAVFVDGCFWHGCPEHFRVPKTRSEFWEEKVRRNQTRRDEVLALYPPEWTVLQYFECGLRNSEVPADVLCAWQ